MTGDDIGFVVRELNIKYIQPLKAADDFVVETQMVEFLIQEVRAGPRNLCF